MERATEKKNRRSNKVATALLFCLSLVFGLLVSSTWLFFKGYHQFGVEFSLPSLMVDILIFTSGSAACFLVSCVCLRSVVKPTWFTWLLLPALLFAQVQIQLHFLEPPVALWVKGFASRISRHLDLQRATEWSKGCVEKYLSGNLAVNHEPIYYSLLEAEIEPHQVPDFVKKPWARRPVIGIMNRNTYTNETCVCFSWYGYYFLLAEPRPEIRDLPNVAIVEPSIDAFVIYDNPK